MLWKPSNSYAETASRMYHGPFDLQLLSSMPDGKICCRLRVSAEETCSRLALASILGHQVSWARRCINRSSTKRCVALRPPALYQL